MCFKDYRRGKNDRFRLMLSVVPGNLVLHPDELAVYLQTTSLYSGSEIHDTDEIDDSACFYFLTRVAPTMTLPIFPAIAWFYTVSGFIPIILYGDMSRFGRNLIDTGYYIERIGCECFPMVG